MKQVLSGDATLQAIIQASPAAIVAVMSDRTVGLWNPAAERIFGWREEEILGRPFPLIPPSHGDELDRNVAFLETGGTLSTETTRQRKDGSIVEVHLQAATIHGAEGPAGWMAIYVDLTEQRRTERALQTRSSEFEAIVQAFPDLYFWFSEDNRVVDHRAGRPGDLFTEPSNFIGLHPRDYLPAGAALDIEAAADRARETGEVQAVEYVLPIEGRDVPFEARMASLGDGRVISVVRNITARRETERELRESLDLLRAVVEGTPDAIFLKDGNGRYLMANAASAAIVGMRPEEMVGRRDDEVLPPDVARRFIRDDEALLKDGRTRIFEEVVPRPGEAARSMLTTKSALRGSDGRITGIVGVSHDVTEYRQLEEQLRRSQKMEAVGRLAGGVAHDFNNLLTVILSSAELIERELPPGHPARAEATQIEQAAERAGELTRQLLAFSRRRVSRPRALDLCEIVQRDERMLRRLVGEDIVMHARVEDAPCTVLADPALIEQILVNLVVNARDAMREGGRIDIEVTTREYETERAALEDGVLPGVYAVLTVRDTGTGMEPEVLAHVFEPFFTTKGPGEGSGLGLSTVYGIVEQLRGGIRVSSRPGEGTTFRILLPRAGSVEASEPEAPGATPSGVETVLLVEDEPAVRELARRSLQAHGYRVLTAAGGPEALRAIERHHGPIDLLVTDAVMPEMSGRQVAEQVRARRPHVKVLFMTGFSADEGLQRGALGRGEALLEKPFTGEALARTVRAVLDETAPPRPARG